MARNDFILGRGGATTGAKALLERGADAALKRRSSTVVLAVDVQAAVVLAAVVRAGAQDDNLLSENAVGGSKKGRGWRPRPL
ncbi:MAG: hypothetical protein WB919_17245 [Candidatus Sulfotelmatobacter sp.]